MAWFKRFDFLVPLVGAAVLSAPPQAYAVSELLQSALQEIEKTGGVINNDSLTEICKFGSPVTQEYGDDAKLSGTKVEIIFDVQSLSKKKQLLSGTFGARSGAFAEEVYVFVGVSSATVPSGLKKGTSVQVTGHLPKSNNDFRSNAMDNCFIEFEADKIEIDGF